MVLYRNASRPVFEPSLMRINSHRYSTRYCQTYTELTITWNVIYMFIRSRSSLQEGLSPCLIATFSLTWSSPGQGELSTLLTISRILHGLRHSLIYTPVLLSHHLSTLTSYKVTLQERICCLQESLIFVAHALYLSYGPPPWCPMTVLLTVARFPKKPRMKYAMILGPCG